MDRFQEAERLAAEGGLALRRGDAACSPGRTSPRTARPTRADPDWSRVVAGPWLAETLKGLRSPEGLAKVDPGRELRGTLRPYQQVGVRWLHLLSRARPRRLPRRRHGPRQDHPGALAPARAARERRATSGGRACSWRRPRCSPTGRRRSSASRRASRSMVAHPRRCRPTSSKSRRRPRSSPASTSSSRATARCCASPGWRPPSWDLVVLDEAQAIKNPDAKQTRAVKKLEARARIALTGTPDREPARRSLVDLRLHQPGPARLGQGVHELRQAARRQAAEPLRPAARPGAAVHPAAPQDRQVRVIADLPDKTEVKAFCQLSRKQAALYQQAVEGAGRAARGRRGDPAQGAGARLPHALQADLQPPVAVARRRRVGRGRQRQVGAPARARAR